jgi:hypothetical protein
MSELDREPTQEELARLHALQVTELFCEYTNRIAQLEEINAKWLAALQAARSALGHAHDDGACGSFQREIDQVDQAIDASTKHLT